MQQKQEWDVMPDELNKVPYELDIELTTYCNLSCSFCPRTQLGLKGKHMDLELYKKIIDEFSRKGGIAVKLNYLGEPFLYPHIIHAIEYAHLKGIKKILINTNGNIIGLETIIKCFLNGLTHITFSIDSCKEEVYKEIRKGGNVHNVFINLFECYLTKEILNLKTPHITVQCIKQPQNQSERESKLFQHHFKNYCDEIRFTELHYTESNKKYEKDNISTAPFLCKEPFRRLVVLVDGSVHICCHVRTEEKYIGSFPNQTIEELWNTTKMNEVRNCFYDNKKESPVFCRDCPIQLEYMKEASK
ncbi:MAG: radical SAM protein [Candidatus Lokiarchaeota archaeon]|nr:radical SAM protein [Candidatus Lokiarchaeota archaeon]